MKRSKGRSESLSSGKKKRGGLRILNKLSSDSVVTVPRYYIDYMVTEFGVAHLFGKNSTKRAEALLAIAHPKFRDELSNQLIRNFRGGRHGF